MSANVTINEKTAPNIPKDVAALLAALQFRGADVKALQGLSASEWHALLSFCDLAHLTLPLQQLDKTGFPDWVITRLEKNASDNAIRFGRVKATYLEAADALESAHAEFMVLKGFAQYPGYVKSPQLRMQSDIDLYFPEEALERACAALMALGYHPEQTQNYSRADHLPAMIRNTGWKWRGNAFDPEMPLSIELHFCLWNEKVSHFSVPNIELFWERRVMRLVDDVRYPTLSAVDNLGYSAIHVLRDLLVGDWIIHHVYELASFLHLQAKDRDFWSSWRELHDDSLRRLEAIAFCLARAWFHCDISPEVEAEIANLPLVIQKWFYTFSGSALEVMFHPNKDRLWLYLSLLNSSQQKLAVLRKVLLPLRAATVKSRAVTPSYRQVKVLWPSQPHIRYMFYFVSRLIYHIRSIPTTLWHGLRWRLSKES